ncbi:MAG TPA: DUF1266 domain-containing protein [Arachidicoccus soli]|nr:DUF1266 domain-containing protein [Arachidicoccus soli]
MMQKKTFQQAMVSITLLALSLIIITGCKNQSSKTDTKSNSTTLRDDTLKGFLLAGVYFVQGYGGAIPFMDKVKDDINKNATQKDFLTMLDTAYHHYFIYPYPRSIAEKVDARNTLSSWFQINNQNDFYSFLASLKDSGFQAHYLVCRKALDDNGGLNADISKINFAKYNLPKGSEVLLKFIKDHYNKFSSSGIKAWNIGLYVYTVCLGYGAEYIDAQNGKSIIVQMLEEAQKDYPDWKTYYNDFMLGRQFAGTDPSANAAYQKTIDGMLQGDYSAYKYLPLRQ